jgi:murein hydrolase activator
MKKRKLAIFLAVLVLVAGPAAAQRTEPTPVPPSEPLEVWRMRIQSAVKAETSLLREIYKVESSEYSLMRGLFNAETGMADLRMRTARAETEIANLSAGMAELRADAGKRLQTTYRLMNRKNVLRVLFRSRDLPSFLRRWRVIKRILVSDRERMMRYQARLNAVVQAGRALENDKVAMVALVREAQEKASAIQSERDKRLYLLFRIQQDRSIAEKTTKDLFEDQQASSAKIADLTKEEPVMPIPEGAFNLDFESRKGYLSLPVNGPIVGFFGPVRNEQLGTVTRNNGIDIAAQEGARVAAVTDGVVRFAGELKGYGRVVILDHGNRYHTLYGHLDRIDCRSGQLVRGGEPVGTVGSSGSLSGPRLHFEVRHRGGAMDPMPWLQRGAATVR